MKRSSIIKLAAILVIIIAFSDISVAQRHERPIVSTRPAHPVVVRQAHLNYAGKPRWGASVAVVPSGAVSLNYRRTPYYAHEGVYYGRRPSGYAVVRPAFGLRINILPIGYRSIAVGPRNYFYYYGAFYQPAGNGYVVVAPPVGAIVDSLPDGYTVENINGIEYYVLDGVTYAEVDAPEYPNGVGEEFAS
jgi:hypothetical protein